MNVGDLVKTRLSSCLWPSYVLTSEGSNGIRPWVNGTHGTMVGEHLIDMEVFSGTVVYVTGVLYNPIGMSFGPIVMVLSSTGQVGYCWGKHLDVVT